MYKVIQRKKKEKRKLRVRKKVFGTREKPRLSVFRSSKYIYGQIIDDEKGETVASISSVSKKTSGGKTKTDTAYEAGIKIAKKCLDKKVKNVVFDKGPYRYHGRVKSFAEGARKGGLNF